MSKSSSWSHSILSGFGISFIVTLYSNGLNCDKPVVEETSEPGKCSQLIQSYWHLPRPPQAGFKPRTFNSDETQWSDSERSVKSLCHGGMPFISKAFNYGAANQRQPFCHVLFRTNLTKVWLGIVCDGLESWKVNSID